MVVDIILEGRLGLGEAWLPCKRPGWRWRWRRYRQASRCTRGVEALEGLSLSSLSLQDTPGGDWYLLWGSERQPTTKSLAASRDVQVVQARLPAIWHADWFGGEVPSVLAAMRGGADDDSLY